MKTVGNHMKTIWKPDGVFPAPMAKLWSCHWSVASFAQAVLAQARAVVKCQCVLLRWEPWLHGALVINWRVRWARSAVLWSSRSGIQPDQSRCRRLQKWDSQVLQKMVFIQGGSCNYDLHSCGPQAMSTRCLASGSCAYCYCLACRWHSQGWAIYFPSPAAFPSRGAAHLESHMRITHLRCTEVESEGDCHAYACVQ